MDVLQAPGRWCRCRELRACRERMCGRVRAAAAAGLVPARLSVAALVAALALAGQQLLQRAHAPPSAAPPSPAAPRKRPEERAVRALNLRLARHARPTRQAQQPQATAISRHLASVRAAAQGTMYGIVFCAIARNAHASPPIHVCAGVLPPSRGPLYYLSIASINTSVHPIHPSTLGEVLLRLCCPDTPASLACPLPLAPPAPPKAGRVQPSPPVCHVRPHHSVTLGLPAPVQRRVRPPAWGEPAAARRCSRGGKARAIAPSEWLRPPVALDLSVHAVRWPPGTPT